MSNYPYRQCLCGKQIHVGGVYECDECINNPPEPMTKSEELLSEILYELRLMNRNK